MINILICDVVIFSAHVIMCFFSERVGICLVRLRRGFIARSPSIGAGPWYLE